MTDQDSYHSPMMFVIAVLLVLFVVTFYLDGRLDEIERALGIQ